MKERYDANREAVLADLEQERALMLDIVRQDLPTFADLVDRLRPDDGSCYVPAGGWEARFVSGVAFIGLCQALVEVGDEMADREGTTNGH